MNSDIYNKQLSPTYSIANILDLASRKNTPPPVHPTALFKWHENLLENYANSFE